MGYAATAGCRVANVANMTPSTDQATGIVTLVFPHADPRRSSLAAGDLLFFKHYENLESWGVYGWAVEGMLLDRVSLWSVSGMGLRCDLCSGVFLVAESDVSIKHGTRAAPTCSSPSINRASRCSMILRIASAPLSQGDAVHIQPPC